MARKNYTHAEILGLLISHKGNKQFLAGYANDPVNLPMCVMLIRAVKGKAKSNEVIGMAKDWLIRCTNEQIYPREGYSEQALLNKMGRCLEHHQ